MKKLDFTLKTKKTINLDMKVEVDGRAVYEGPAHSIVGNFARMLYTRAAGVNNVSAEGPYISSTYEEVITNITVGTGTRLRVHFSNDHQFGANNIPMYIFGVRGVPSLTPGLYTVANAWANNSGSYWVELTGTEGFDPSGYVANSGGAIRKHSESLNRNESWNYDLFAGVGIWLGTGTTAIAIEDRMLANKIPNGTGPGALQYGGMTISLPAIDANKSEITFSRQFTNNSGGTIQMEEMGLFCRGTASTERGYMIARDLLQVSIPNGSTVTLSYKLSTTFSATGGTTVQFNEMLTRAFKEQTREAKDTGNANRTVERNWWDFTMYSYAGSHQEHTEAFQTAVEGDDIGPVVGTGTTAMSQTDYQLATRVAHTPITNPVDGALSHFGSFVDGFEENTTSDYCQFKVHRLFYNSGTTPVVITEAGLQCGGGFTTNNNSEGIHYSYLLARHLLGEGNEVTVDPGEALLVTYTFRVEI